MEVKSKELEAHSMRPGPGVSTWQQGATAAREGARCDRCPYPQETYNYVTWMNGYAVAKHNIAREDEL